jgi:Uma2 family endonuclease
MSETTRLVTAEELERYPDDDYRYELVEGRIIRMSPVGYDHGRVVARAIYLLQQHLAGDPTGVVLTEVGFKLASNPDTVRAPDVAFIHRRRLPPTRAGFWHGQPDLAIEVLSPDDRPGEIRAKVTEYLAHGVDAVVIVDPDSQSVAVHRRAEASQTLTGDDVLDLDPVVPGFRCTVSSVFA